MPDITIEQETQNIVDYIYDKASKIGENIVKINNDVILSLVNDKEWEKAKAKKEDLKQRAINRIRHNTEILMKLKENDIEVEWEETGYAFTINKEILKQKIKENGQKTKKEIVKKEQTFSNFETTYIPPRQFHDFVEIMKMGEKPIIIGPKGCGKSRMAEEAAAFLGLECIRIALGQISEPADLIGTKEIVEENGIPVTKYIPGLITEFAQKGGVVILDEIDSVQPHVGLALNFVLESTNKIVCPTEKGTQIIDVHPDFRIVATANSWGYGDDSGFYAGVEVQNRATWDRLRPKINMEYDPETEQLILNELIEDKENMKSENIMNMLYDERIGLINKIRKAIEKQEIYDECSMRSLIAFTKHYNVFGYHKAMYWFINEFKPEYREIIQEMLATSFGEWAKGSVNDYDSDKPYYIAKELSDMEYRIKEIFNA